PTEEQSLTLTQSIYSYSNWADFAKAKRERAAGDADFRVVEQDLILNVAEAYFAALSVYEDLNSIQSEVRAVKEYYDFVRAKREDGLVRQTDLLDAQARYLQAHSRELEIRSNLNDAMQGLREVTGQLPQSLKLLSDNIALKAPNPDSPEAWLEKAIQANPELAGLRERVDVARHEMRSEKGGRYPTLDLTFEKRNRNTQGTLFGGGSEVETQEITFELTVPLYSGGEVSSKIREARAGYSKVQEDLDAELRAVQRDIYAAYDSILSDMAKVEVLAKSVEAYESGAETKRVAYEAGLASGLTVLDAERDLFFARTEYAHARYGYVLSMLRLKRVAGTLSMDDLVELDDQLSDETYTVAAYSRLPKIELN
ncbi:MAG: TolC family outer membrane protein, partial [Pontibacterium sp.]